MYIWSILIALLFTFGMCWVAILNKDNLISIVIPPGNITLQAYIWEIVLASAAATAVFIGIIAIVKGLAHRRWEKDIEGKIGELGVKIEGLAGKLEDLELKMASFPPKVEEMVKSEVPEGEKE